MTLADLNEMQRGPFVEAVGWVFEQSPWVAERAWHARPFTSVDALHEAMTTAMRRATTDEQLSLLRAHPDLGTRARMSDQSVAEQAGAGLDRLSPLQFETLQRLNREYREAFGFPFLYAVKGRRIDDILASLEKRCRAKYDDEFEEALQQVSRIARFRLEESIDGSM
jgi:2-oxo-4-hydroxy-4-carboxy-5-ureidoimidazoline decarboxylase